MYIVKIRALHVAPILTPAVTSRERLHRFEDNSPAHSEVHNGPVTKISYILYKFVRTQILLSTAVDQVVACALVTQQARVRSPVGTSFLGEVFWGFSSPVRQRKL